MSAKCFVSLSAVEKRAAVFVLLRLDLDAAGNQKEESLRQHVRADPPRGKHTTQRKIGHLNRL